MVKNYYRWIFVLSGFAVLVSALSLIGPGRANADPQQYPILDRVADKVIQKYQTSTCEQLWQERAQKGKAPPPQMEQEALQMLKSDSQMRTIFINKVAGPIANKMFQCGMIP
jgi:hypothetical protein